MQDLINDVEHPSHYYGDGTVECKDAERSMLNGYGNKSTNYEASLAGQILQYLWRYPHKGGVKDLKKARQMLDFLIAEVEEG